MISSSEGTNGGSQASEIGADIDYIYCMFIPLHESANPSLMKLITILVADLLTNEDDEVWFWRSITGSVAKANLPDFRIIQDLGVDGSAFESPDYERLQHLLFALAKRYPDNRRRVGYCLTLWTELGVIPLPEFAL